MEKRKKPLRGTVMKEPEKEFESFALTPQTFSVSKVKKFIAYGCDKWLVVDHRSALFSQILLHPQIVVACEDMNLYSTVSKG